MPAYFGEYRLYCVFVNRVTAVEQLALKIDNLSDDSHGGADVATRMSLRKRNQVFVDKRAVHVQRCDFILRARVYRHFIAVPYIHSRLRRDDYYHVVRLYRS